MDASRMVYHSLYHQQSPQKRILDPACGRTVEFLGLAGWWCNSCEVTVPEPRVELPEQGPCPFCEPGVA